MVAQAAIRRTIDPALGGVIKLQGIMLTVLKLPHVKRDQTISNLILIIFGRCALRPGFKMGFLRGSEAGS